MSKRVYIAGKLNGMAVEYTKNIHRMIFWGEKIRKLGYSVYIPAIDFLTGAVIGNYEYADYFENSQSWLDVSDAVFLVPGWKDSEGTKREIARAMRRGIPVFTSMIKLDEELSKDIK